MDYCFNPRKLLRDGEWILVPCNKCEGCLLHKANLWSQRLAFEIDNNPFSIFFTLTYSNKYIPTLVPISHNNQTMYFTYISDHDKNIRFDGSKDVLRNDGILIDSRLYDIPLTNDPRKYVVNYASKRDFQLWLKLMRKDIIEFLNPDYGSESFRYFGISEKGPTFGRWHIHGLLFPRNKEIAEFLLSCSMFKNWQMCDEVLFREHTKYCDSGTSMYVTNYVTNYSKLPAIYKDTAIKPFRLSSKSPAIGYSPFDAKKVFEDVSRGIIEYTRTISRADQSSLLRYPSDYMARLFPKCYQFTKLPYSRLLFIYGCLYRSVRGAKLPYICVSDRLSKVEHASDWQAMQACFRWCDVLGCTPFHYLYLLDLYYYKRAMSALKVWYEWQQHQIEFPLYILSSYVNLQDYVLRKDFLSPSEISALRLFLESFGIVFDDFTYSDFQKIVMNSPGVELYKREVVDITDNLEKMPKFNELNGSAPHNY